MPKANHSLSKSQKPPSGAGYSSSRNNSSNAKTFDAGEWIDDAAGASEWGLEGAGNDGAFGGGSSSSRSELRPPPSPQYIAAGGNMFLQNTRTAAKEEGCTLGEQYQQQDSIGGRSRQRGSHGDEGKGLAAPDQGPSQGGSRPAAAATTGLPDVDLTLLQLCKGQGLTVTDVAAFHQLELDLTSLAPKLAALALQLRTLLLPLLPWLAPAAAASLTKSTAELAEATAAAAGGLNQLCCLLPAGPLLSANGVAMAAKGARRRGEAGEAAGAWGRGQLNDGVGRNSSGGGEGGAGQAGCSRRAGAGHQSVEGSVSGQNQHQQQQEQQCNVGNSASGIRRSSKAADAKHGGDAKQGSNEAVLHGELGELLQQLHVLLTHTCSSGRRRTSSVNSGSGSKAAALAELQQQHQEQMQQGLTVLRQVGEGVVLGRIVLLFGMSHSWCSTGL